MVEARKRILRELSLEIGEETLRVDLENYKQMALQLGAARAEVIPVQWVQVDERVRLKCSIPPCPNYNRCGYCPPYTPEPDYMREAFNRFNWAILFAIDVPVEDFTDVNRYYPYGKDYQRKTGEIVAKIETTAFADGYRFAMGFGAGGCRDTLCNGGLCRMLDSGRCPHILKARPSMEAVGIDACDLAKKVGWSVYPIYRGVDPKTIPSAVCIGIVFIH